MHDPALDETIEQPTEEKGTMGAGAFIIFAAIVLTSPVRSANFFCLLKHIGDVSDLSMKG